MKRTTTAIFALGLAALGSLAAAQAEITPPASGVTASTNDGNVPANAVDNNLGTRWSGNGDGAWLQLDLGSVRPIGRVAIAFFNGNLRRSRFDLQVATTVGSWTNVLTDVQSGGTTTADESFDFTDVDARYVRYLGHGNDDPAKATWSSLSEVSIFEGVTGPTATPTPTSTSTPTPTPTSTPTPTPTPEATPTPTPTPFNTTVELTPGATGVTASTHDGNLPANTVDKSLASRWSGNGDGAWIQYDLGAMKTVRYVKIAVYNGNGRQNRFDLQVSLSSTGPWGNVLTNALTSGTTTQLETHDFGDISARYVRYLGHMSNVGSFNSLTEVEVWGSECADCPPPPPTPTPTPTSTPTPTPTDTPGGECARTVNVATSAQLSAAVGSALPGDCIILANGNYSAFAISRDGTSTAPILIRAANRGGAVITSGVIRFVGAAWVTVEGLRLTGPGGSVNADGSTYKAAIHFEAATRCRVTRCTLRLAGHTGSTEWILLSGNSRNNRIDHNELGPNSVDGHLVWPRGNPTISGVTPPADRTSWANGNGPVNPNIARDTLIDHNYFHDHMNTTSNGAEVIVTGGMGMTGDYQFTNTIIEYNVFQDSWGDGELISCKSSGTVIRYNTMRRCGGGPVSRAGNGTQIYGNFILGENRANSGGIRIHEMDHNVYNNHIENIAGQAVIVGNGDPYCCGSFSHAQVKRAKVVHNTIVNAPGGFTIGNSHPLQPIDLVVANNILVNTAFNGPSPLSGWIYSQNIAWPNAVARPGFLNVNPMHTSTTPRHLMAGSPAIDAANQGLYSWITDDMDGQARSTRDIGSDEFSSAPATRRPLMSTDVGPNAP
jgi:poly(beta-D-mannuronate) lyase